MKSIKGIYLPFLILISCTDALGETKNFDGLSVYLSGSTNSTTIRQEYRNIDANLDGSGKNSFSGEFGIDYGLTLLSNYFVLLGATHSLNKSAADERSSNNFTTKFKDGWSIYAAPAIIRGDNHLVYLKVAYVSAQLQRTSDTFDYGNPKTHAGVGYGAGARLFLNENIFVNMELMQSRYGKKTYDPDGLNVDFSAITTSGTIAVGYKF